MNLAGDYTVTFIADSACAAALPAELRTRTYAATITAVPPSSIYQENTRYKIALSGALFDSYYNWFSVGVAGDYLAFWLGDEHIIEQLAGNTHLEIAGAASASSWDLTHIHDLGFIRRGIRLSSGFARTVRIEESSIELHSAMTRRHAHGAKRHRLLEQATLGLGHCESRRQGESGMNVKKQGPSAGRRLRRLFVLVAVASVLLPRMAAAQELTGALIGRSRTLKAASSQARSSMSAPQRLLAAQRR